MTDLKTDNEPKAETGIPWTLVLGSMLAVLVSLFAIQNSSDVLIKLLLWRGQVPLSLLLFSTLAAGVLLAVLFSIPAWNRRRKLNKYYKSRIGELQARLKAEPRKPAVPQPPAPAPAAPQQKQPE